MTLPVVRRTLLAGLLAGLVNALLLLSIVLLNRPLDAQRVAAPRRERIALVRAPLPAHARAPRLPVTGRRAAPARRRDAHRSPSISRAAPAALPPDPAEAPVELSRFSATLRLPTPPRQGRSRGQAAVAAGTLPEGTAIARAVQCDVPSPPSESPPSESEGAASAAGAPRPSRTRAAPTRAGPTPRDARGVDVPPRPLHTPHPRYPAAARRRGAGGLVRVRFVIDARGVVTRWEIRETRGADAFARAVREVIPTWRFEPARDGGAPVAVWAEKTLRFELEEER